MQEIRLDQPRSGSYLLLDTLHRLGVDLVFGYPGGAVLPLYDAIYQYEGIQHILARHEQGAVHEAEGYAKSSGKVGVAIVTSGPGATNAITGIVDAMGDSVPLLVFTGQVATRGIGKDTFQEADVLGMTMPITKYNYQIRDAADIPRIVTEALHIATTGRPGPVVIDVPKDIQEKVVEFYHDPSLHLPSYQPIIEPDDVQVKKILQQLSRAKKPVILAGGGVNYADAGRELVAFAERYQIPVVSTLLGLGAIPIEHDLSLAMGGMHGSYAANMAMDEADYLINVGARFDDRLTGNPATYAPNATIAHIDIDPSEIGKIVETAIPVVGDAKATLTALLKLEPVKTNHATWTRQVLENKRRAPFGYDEDSTCIKPQAAIELVGQLTDGDAIIVTDVGQHQMWTAQFYPYKHIRQLVTSGGMGTMGFGIPAAIGAKLANPDKEVIVFVGDGGFQMTNQELALLNGYGVPIKIILMNNHSLGMVRQWQESFYENRRSQSVFNDEPNFQLLAEAYGISHYHLKNPATLAEDIKVILEDRPMLIEVHISNREHVQPMVPAGKSNAEMLGVKFNA
ncbi:acetolactate synthase large subunit [Streptococcus ruminantium]|uniref:Acetolactate synthase n=1 Tax=Streptococcus ruminantium TaxID=1917441 RepID=A0ABU1B2F9_9STRE|nr:acetolactate synthase large subunit [Streptococcus ruminantium]MDQ8758632.1 acetolactate synthase large subunit [Streptococcus ruminantium]MDQ8769394.1 acetolactate synthase large subunit [Streptococcus ruminantium]MDQ8774091.1 acetolactate synthase large subunit [Streptococcus ruminantium]MDQ8793119.1 acetolactate synthase large subunit [Streptococcus ruminantium]MDQ8795275.1 acetolactate synthase large subunit [Streptococcus ruminantium]